MIRLRTLLEDVLSERVSDVVYHATTIHSLEKIIKSDTFRLNKFDWDADVAWAKDNNLMNYYYMSVARSVSSDFLRYEELVTLRLDGKKLNNVGKSRSYDFPHHVKKYTGMSGASFGDEMEDRILSKNRTIPNFSKYITGLWIPDSALDVVDGNIRFMELFKKMEGMSIPLFSCLRQEIPSFNSKCAFTYDEVYEIING